MCTGIQSQRWSEAGMVHDCPVRFGHRTICVGFKAKSLILRRARLLSTEAQMAWELNEQVPAGKPAAGENAKV